MKLIAILLLVAGPFAVWGQRPSKLPLPCSKVIWVTFPTRPWYDKAKSDSAAADSLRIQRAWIAAQASVRDSVKIMSPDGMPCVIPMYVQQMYR